MQNMIKCPVSLGELVDKISILKIKKQKIPSAEKQAFVKQELEELMEVLKASSYEDVSFYLNQLEEVNRKLWEIEDSIRVKESKREFDQDFIELARAVYFTNNERFELKNELNKKFGSSIVEVKSYATTQGI